MTIEATAQALAGNEPVPAPVSQEMPSPSDDDGLEAAFDKFQAASTEDVQEDAPVEEAPETVEQGEQEAAEAEKRPEAEAEAPKPSSAPTDLPKAVKDHWEAIPEDAREGLIASQRDMSNKLANMSRQFKGIEPIRDVLVDAIKENPGIANMQPGELAKEVIDTARLASKFRENPLDTLIAIAKENKIDGQLVQKLQGVTPSAQQQASDDLIKELRTEIASLRKAADPAHLHQQLDQYMSHRQAVDVVEQFAATADHWDQVEPYMAQLIPLAQAKNPNASSQDVLREAYALGVAQFVPGQKAKAEAGAEQATAVADPAKTEAAKRAISANVKGSKSGKAKELSEEDTLSAAFDRASRS